MDVRCDKCQARYRIEDARVAQAGPAGLTMRCGKCSNTFKVTKEGAVAPAASKPPPAAAPAGDLPGSTMMFQAPKIPPPAAKPAPVPAPAPAAPSGDLPGATMMFVSPVAKAAPAAAKPAPAPAAPSGDLPGATMMFVSPVAKAAPAAAKPAPAPAKAPAGNEDSGSTMMFGAPVKLPPVAAAPAPAPAAPKPPPAPAPPPRPAPAPEPVKAAEPDDVASGDEETARGDAPDTAPSEEPVDAGDEPTRGEPMQAKSGEAVGEDDVDPAAMTSEQAGPPEGEDAPPPAPKAPLPMGLILGGVGAVVVLALGGLAFMKMRPHPPSPAAIQALADARALLDKDSLASFQPALDGDLAAIAAAPKAPFPEAHALQSEIELAWGDALADQSALLADKSSRTDDDKKKAELDAASQKAADESKVHIKNALELAKAVKASSPNSPDAHLALADYYRSTKGPSFERELKAAAALKADEAQLAGIEGSKLLGDDDATEKGLAKLKTALAANPQSAHLQYRIAQAQVLLKNDAEEMKALAATLKLSPGHERAKLMLEALQAQAAPANPPAATP